MKIKKIGLKDISYFQKRYPDQKMETNFQNQFLDEFHEIKMNFRSSSPKKRFFSKKIFWKIIFLLIISTFSIGIYFTWKIISIKQKVSLLNEEKSMLLRDIQSIAFSVLPGSQKLIGENDGRINILLLGIAGKNNPGQNLTDTIVIMSIDTKNKKTALLSLPRDLYVRVPNTNFSTKINSLYQYGLSTNQEIKPLQKVIEEIIGLPLHYFLILDFDGFKKIIDNIGGINVYVDQAIYDSRYPGPNYSYETFEIQKGTQFLDGETALKYVRVRHGDPEGDFGRAKRQQKVIQATKNKIFSSQTFLNIFTLNKLLNILGDHIKTNIQLNEIESFIRLSKEVDTQNITTVVVDAWKKDSLLKVSRITTKNGLAFILIPRVGSYSEIQELAENIFDLDVIRRRQEEIKKENASVVILNRSADGQLDFKIKKLLQDSLGIKKVSIVNESNRNISDFSFVKVLSGTEKIFTLDELLKKLPARIDSKVSIENNNAIIRKEDFIIILGRDLEKIYSFKEDTLENWKKSAENYQEYFEFIENENPVN